MLSVKHWLHTGVPDREVLGFNEIENLLVPFSVQCNSAENYQ